METNARKTLAQRLRDNAPKWRAIRFLCGMMWRYGRSYTLISLLVSVVIGPLLNVVNTLMPQKVIDSLVNGAGVWGTLGTVGVFLLLSLLLNGVSVWCSQCASQTALLRMNWTLQREVFRRSLYMDFRYFDDPEYCTKCAYAQQQCTGQVQSMGACW